MKKKIDRLSGIEACICINKIQFASLCMNVCIYVKVLPFIKPSLSRILLQVGFMSVAAVNIAVKCAEAEINFKLRFQ